MKKMFVLAISMIVVCSLISCTAKKADASVFEGRKVVLKSFVSEEEAPINTLNPVFIEFNKEEKKVNGSAACNRFFGSYELDGDKITFGQVGSTKMMCDPISNEVEMKIMNLLNTTNRFETTENSVIFYKDLEKLGEFIVESGKSCGHESKAKCEKTEGTSCCSKEKSTCEKLDSTKCTKDQSACSHSTTTDEKKCSSDGVCKTSGKTCCSVDKNAKCCKDTKE